MTIYVPGAMFAAGKIEEIVFADDWLTDFFRIKDEQFWEKMPLPVGQQSAESSLEKGEITVILPALSAGA